MSNHRGPMNWPGSPYRPANSSNSNNGGRVGEEDGAGGGGGGGVVVVGAVASGSNSRSQPQQAGTSSFDASEWSALPESGSGSGVSHHLQHQHQQQQQQQQQQSQQSHSSGHGGGHSHLGTGTMQHQNNLHQHHQQHQQHHHHDPFSSSAGQQGVGRSPPPPPPPAPPLSTKDSNQDKGKNTVKEKKSNGGRPKDKIWAFFTSQENRAQCRYCSWHAEHPKPARMRTHAQVCPGLPPEQYELLLLWNHERKTKQVEKDKDKGKKGKGPGSSGEEDDDDGEGDDDGGAAGESPGANGSRKKAKRQRLSEPGPSGSGSSTMHNGLTPPVAPPAAPTHPPPPTLPEFASGQSFEVAMGGSRFRLVPMPALRSPVTCHVLDSTFGKPAASMRVRLDRFDGQAFTPYAHGLTDTDGRCSNLLTPAATIEPGVYKMIFSTKEYFTARGVSTFYPWVEIPFEITAPDEHYRKSGTDRGRSGQNYSER